MSEQIRDALMERIFDGSLPPGERIIELKVAEEMGTSQAPVREALRELEAAGLVEIRRNRGARVRIVGEAELAEIYGIRAELEGYAGELAAKAAPEISAVLDAVLDRMIEAAEASDSKRFAELNSEFHSAIVEAGGNATLAELWRGLHVRSHTRMNVRRNATDLYGLAQSHRPIIDAIRSGDAAEARATSWQHVRDNTPGSAEGKPG
ncbi:GntR family transcriptional regulator [Jannaschia aquimarina]|uniref:GntR family transcriptional regulator n=1 Tax=Jannaschia aquimarina TaxID=935700 RepID=UPI0013791844|nr:GntR family transcriptional regulator [Jannaschia aquimarina]